MFNAYRKSFIISFKKFKNAKTKRDGLKKSAFGTDSF
jgi:hypothetical protein